MEQDQQQAEKKIWVDPELTYMPMEKIKSYHNVHQHEVIAVHNDDYSAHNDDAGNLGS